MLTIASHKSKHLVKYYKIYLLIVLLIYVAVSHSAFHENAHFRYNTQTPVQWIQPLALFEKYPQPISNKSWLLDYNHIEKVLWQSKANTAGELLINSDTSNLLKQASVLLPKNMSPIELQRLTFLIEKSLPDDSGKQLAELLPRYYFYQQDYESSLSIINKAKEGEKLALLKVSQIKHNQLQVNYFGEDIAKKLFSKKNITIHYLNGRRIINMTKNLTDVQKKRQLSALKENYKSARLETENE